MTSNPETPGPLPIIRPRTPTEQLIDQGDTTVAAVLDLTKAVRANTRRLKWTQALGVVVLVVMALVVLDNHQQINRAKAQICRAVVQLASPNPPPAAGRDGDRGRVIIRSFGGLATDFECSKRS